MSVDSKFKDYIIKKVILEIRHPPIFDFTEKLPSKLNKLAVDFTHHRVRQDSKSGITYILENHNDYWYFTAQWNRIGMAIENVKKLDASLPTLKKYIISLLHELEINLIKRLGIRIIYFIPFEGKFDELVVFFKRTFYSNIDMYEALGNINDVGVIVMTMTDELNNINFSLGPFDKMEAAEKISTFKKYDDEFETALMADIDMYKTNIQIDNVYEHIENSIASASNKINSFHKKLISS